MPDVRAIFCDESSQTTGRYFAVGGVVVPLKELNTFCFTLYNAKIRAKVKAEMKWVKVSMAMLPTYRAFVDAFFDFLKNSNAQFRCFLVDKELSSLSSPQYTGGSEELGFYKFYFQAIKNGLVRHTRGRDTQYLVTLDERKDYYKHQKEVLFSCINRAAHRDWSLQHDICSQWYQYNSKLSVVLQLVDVLLGAITRCWNATGTMRAKRNLLSHIEKRIAGMMGTPKPLRRDFRPAERPFNIWHFNPRRLGRRIW